MSVAEIKAAAILFGIDNGVYTHKGYKIVEDGKRIWVEMPLGKILSSEQRDKYKVYFGPWSIVEHENMKLKNAFSLSGFQVDDAKKIIDELLAS